MTLSIDSDAAQLAALARAESVRNAAIVVGNAPLQRRFSAAFATAWRRGGGIPPREYSFDPNPEQLGLLRRELAARPPDAILLAVDGNDAALAKSFLPPVPVFVISQIADGLPLAMLRDLEGVRYVEIPWLADPGAPQFAGVPRPNYGDPVLERLYALGLDAFAVAQLIAQPVPPERIELDGATGHLSLTPAHSFQRDGRVMVIRAGQIGPYESPR